MRIIHRPLAAFLACFLPLLLAACDAPGSNAPAGPGYSVCRPPEPGAKVQVCG